MASRALDDDALITDINVTPLVDITLVLLVVMMITASYVAAKTIPMDLPRSATGETTPVVLAVSITSDGQLFLDATPTDEAGLRRGIIAARSDSHEPQAIIAADGRTPHARVVHVIDVLRQERVTKFAINVEPEGERR
ncbi:MAG: Biopolymer transport protein ExbD/TolR [Myxococcales bacterium]|nr:Biopolymer transport protein ExbD/TolR [Myxococcales bacterium]